MKKYEYLEFTNKTTIEVEKLNSLGLDGWELATVIVHDLSVKYFHYIFKREIL